MSLTADVLPTGAEADAVPSAATAGLGAMVDHLDEVVFGLDARGCWTFLSAAWERCIGWSRAESLHRPAVPFVHRRDRAAMHQLWTEAVAGARQGYRGEVRFRDGQGGMRCMLIRARRLDDAAGEFAGFTGTMAEISNEKAAEAALVRACVAAETASRAKSEFLAAMGHELRTPLNAVIGLTESLLEAFPAPDPDRSRRYLSLIHASGQQLLSQVNDLMDLARIEAGQIKPLCISVDLTTMCTLAAEGLRREASMRGIEVALVSPGVPVLAKVDERLVRRVVQALMTNAVKVTRSQGRIAVELMAAAGGRVTVRVRDEGRGSTADLQSPRRAATAEASVRQLNGTDLVLALADRVARLHGGAITVESVAGQGSTVTVGLPAADGARTTTAHFP